MMIWEAAERNADSVRRAVEQRDGKFTLAGAADLLGVQVIHTGDLGPGVSGMVIKTSGDEVCWAYINNSDIPTRQRFTLAHELGHVVERQMEAKDPAYSFRDDRGTKYDLHEFYADQFAGALLMPAPLVRSLSPHLRDSDALSITSAFEVSVPAAHKRLERLRKQSGDG